MGEIRLEKLLVKGGRVDYWFKATKDIAPYFKPELHLFTQYDRDVETVPQSILVIPFLSNAMQIAWLTDADVYVPCVDSVFYDSLFRLREAYRRMYPHCSLQGTLHTSCEINTSPSPNIKSAQMYTGGLDAVTTFIRHEAESPLLILEYGFYQDNQSMTYDKDEVSERNFLSDRKAALKFAKEHGVETAFIRANYGTFVNSSAIDRKFSRLMGDDYWHGLHHAMAILGAAAPIAYCEGINNLYIASSFSVGNTYPCASDPTTDNEFCFATTSAIHDGYELTDQDKAKLVVSYQKRFLSPLPLRVCSWNDHNCCACEKCLRRMLQLNAEGGDPQNFGFSYGTSVLDTTQRFLRKEIQFFTGKNIDKWQHIIQRMGENLSGAFDKDIYDYLVNYDFEKEKRIGLLRYYFENFFTILKRKTCVAVKKGLSWIHPAHRTH